MTHLRKLTAVLLAVIMVFALAACVVRQKL